VLYQLQPSRKRFTVAFVRERPVSFSAAVIRLLQSFLASRQSDRQTGFHEPPMSRGASLRRGYVVLTVIATTTSSASLIGTPCFLLLYREPFTDQTFPTLTVHPYLSVIRNTPEDRLSAYSWFFLNRVSLRPSAMGSTSSRPTTSIFSSTPYTGHVSPGCFSPFGRVSRSSRPSRPCSRWVQFTTLHSVRIHYDPQAC
jgi:hypothetical protein